MNEVIRSSDGHQRYAEASETRLSLESVLDNSRADAARVSGLPQPSPNVRIGRIVGLSDSGMPLVVTAGLDVSPIIARSVVRTNQEVLGQEAVLVFEEGDPQRPIIIGLLQPAATESREAHHSIKVQHDGERLLLAAEQEIVLRCGEASITLTRAGKVILRGNYLLSRSSGANCIKGGSVEIN